MHAQSADQGWDSVGTMADVRDKYLVNDTVLCVFYCYGVIAVKSTVYFLVFAIMCVFVLCVFILLPADNQYAY